MKVYGLVILLCLSLLFIKYSEAQVVSSNPTLSDQKIPISNMLTKRDYSYLNDPNYAPKLGKSKVCGNHICAPGEISSNLALSNSTIPSNRTLSNSTIPSNYTSFKQINQLLEKKFFKSGNTLFDQGNYTAAISYYDKVLVLNSTNIGALYNKALAFDSLNRTDEAITYYDKVLAINPNDTDSLNNKALALDNLGKHDKAITYYDKVLAINPQDTDALYNKGVSLDSLGKKDDAILYYKKVLEVNPGDVAASTKLNLAFNIIHKNKDQTLLIGLGVLIILLISIIIFDLIKKRTRHESETNIITKSDQEKVD